MTERDIETLRTLPKTKLHVHLDCCLGLNGALAIDPELTPEDYATRFVAPRKCEGLLDYFRYLEPSIALMQTPEAVRLATLDLLAQFDADDALAPCFS